MSPTSREIGRLQNAVQGSIFVFPTVSVRQAMRHSSYVSLEIQQPERARVEHAYVFTFNMNSFFMINQRDILLFPFLYL
jgi:hypothetical protein